MIFAAWCLSSFCFHVSSKRSCAVALVVSWGSTSFSAPVTIQTALAGETSLSGYCVWVLLWRPETVTRTCRRTRPQAHSVNLCLVPVRFLTHTQGEGEQTPAYLPFALTRCCLDSHRGGRNPDAEQQSRGRINVSYAGGQGKFSGAGQRQICCEARWLKKATSLIGVEKYPQQGRDERLVTSTSLHRKNVKLLHSHFEGYKQMINDQCRTVVNQRHADILILAPCLLSANLCVALKA